MGNVKKKTKYFSCQKKINKIKIIFQMQANGVVEELCGIWIQKYFIFPKTQH